MKENGGVRHLSPVVDYLYVSNADVQDTNGSFKKIDNGKYSKFMVFLI